jgi:hypothetical protein
MVTAGTVTTGALISANVVEVRQNANAKITQNKRSSILKGSFLFVFSCLFDKRNGGGGGSRTHVRNYLQQRAFMLFRVPLCLVIDA